VGEPARETIQRAAPPGENLLLAALPGHRRLASLTERLEIPIAKTIYEIGSPITHYYFPVRGVFSLVKDMRDGVVEVGTVGPEGMVGIPALLGVGITSTRVLTQSEVVTDRIAVADLDAAFESSPGTRHILLRYVLAFHEEVAQSVVCNRLHTLEERCARWLLMMNDRTGDETMHVKQRFLSYMLGVHRPAVSIAAGALQRAGFIRYSRGSIRIVDRAGLEDAACECYAIGRENFARARLPVATAESG
jgi:CRP-like cAMP-binding protein